MTWSNEECPFCLEKMKFVAVIHKSGLFVHVACQLCTLELLISFYRQHAFMEVEPNFPLCRQEIDEVYRDTIFLECGKCLEFIPNFFFNLMHPRV